MKSLFRLNMERYNRIRSQLNKHNLDTDAGGIVIDLAMPKVCRSIVCYTKDLVDVDNGFLEANPVIAKHLKERESKIQKHKDEQAEAHACRIRTQTPSA